jgi:ankyrin repeat protein
LLEANANPDAKDKFGETPLHEAARIGDTAILRLLLKDPAKLRARLEAQSGDDRIFTALHAAAHSGRAEAVRFLLDLGADPEAKGTGGFTPLHLGADAGHLEVVEELLGRSTRGGDRPEAGFRARGGSWQATALHFAALRGHDDVVKSLLGHGADAKARDSGGASPLHWAAGLRDDAVRLERPDQAYGDLPGRARALEQLVRRDASAIDAPDDEGRTPLDIAARDGHLKMVDLLIKQGAGVVPRAGERAAPLHWAVSSGQEKIVERLLAQEAGLQLASADDSGFFPLHLAIIHGRPAIARRLLEAGADPETRDHAIEVSAPPWQGPLPWQGGGATSLAWAARVGDQETVNLLLARGANPRAVDRGTRRTILHWAAEASPITLLKKRKVRRVDTPDHAELEDVFEQVTVLTAGTDDSRAKIVRTLISRGAAPDAADASGYTPLHVAIISGPVAVVRELLSDSRVLAGIDSPTRGDGLTPFLLAASAARPEKQEVLEALIQKHADPTRTDEAQHTALHLAALAGDDRIIPFLIQHKVDPEAGDDEKHTALHEAAYRGFSKVAEALLAANVQVDPRDDRSWTPLHAAAYGGREETIKVLLRHHADPGAKTGEGRTPWELIKELLRHHADPGAKTGKGRTPKDLASEGGYTEAVRLLDEALARKGANRP